MPGQTPRLWQPFEKWVTRVADGIASRQKKSSDKLEEGLRNYITVDPDRTVKLHTAAIKYSADAVALERRLDQIQAEVKPSSTPETAWEQRQSRARVDALLTDLRASKPEQYAELLKREKVFTGARYWTWFRGLGPKLTGVIGALVIIGLLSGAFWIFCSTPSQHAYFRWRFAKVDATPQDRFRSREYFENRLRNAATDPATARQLIMPLLDDLRFKEISSLLVDDITRVIIDSHSRALDAITIPALIEDLRTESPTVRLTIHRTLGVLAAADYQGTSLQDLASWTPSKEESPGQIDEKVRNWLAWWQKASAGP